MHEIKITFTLRINPHPDDVSVSSPEECLATDIKLFRKFPFEHLEIFDYTLDVDGKLI